MDSAIVESQKLKASGDGDISDDVAFLPKNDQNKNSPKRSVNSDEYRLLTKDDLIRLDREEPIWRRLRIALIVCFWVVWIALLVASALIIVFTQKCPPRPALSFWQSKSAYWINPFAFKDTNGDLVGDLKGIISEVDYIGTDVGAGFVVLTPLSPWHPRRIPSVVEYVPAFDSIHPSLGTIDDFVSLVKSLKKKGMELVLSLDFNGISVNHDWTKKKNYIIPYDSSIKLSRTSEKPAEKIGENEYYSTFGSGSGMVDLNLNAEEVVEEIKNVTNFWLSKGVDGILLSDAAFYVETTDGCSETSTWFEALPSCRLFTNQTLGIVQQIRSVIDASAKKAGRAKVLIADAGNIGYGIDGTDNSLKFLGTSENPGAHLTVNREFAFARGWKINPQNSVLTKNSISSLTKIINDSKAHLALTTASPSDAPYNSIYSFVGSILMPGTPMVYYGSELGINPLHEMPNDSLYPFGDASKPNEGFDRTIASNLPMAWDNSGRRFSSNSSISHLFPSYLQTCNILDTVEAATAAGRGYNMFNLTKDLLFLRKSEPSLIWGNLVMDLQIEMSSTVEIFKRKAEGFPAIVTVLLQENSSVSILDFSKICTTITPILVYPANQLLEIGVELSKTTIYLNSPDESVYVFKCHD